MTEIVAGVDTKKADFGLRGTFLLTQAFVTCSVLLSIGACLAN